MSFFPFKYKFEKMQLFQIYHKKAITKESQKYKYCLFYPVS